jgi:hypothetical protein
MWKLIVTAPFGQDLELAVFERDGPQPLLFPCRRVVGGWAKADTMKRIDVSPTHWREWQALP